jgi:hypothetical protein
VEQRTEIFQNARAAISLITSDLRSACVLSNDFPFVGMDRTLEGAEADNLDFATHFYRPKKARESDFCVVSYFLNQEAKNGSLSLFRRRNPFIAGDAFSGGKREEIIQNVRGLRFEYFDGLEWQDSWGESNVQGSKPSSSSLLQTGLPDAVRITIWLETENLENRKNGNETKFPAQMIQTIVRLNLAPMTQRSSNAGSSSSRAGPDDGSNPAGPNQPTIPGN